MFENDRMATVSPASGTIDAPGEQQPLTPAGDAPELPAERRLVHPDLLEACGDHAADHRVRGEHPADLGGVRGTEHARETRGQHGTIKHQRA